MLSASDEVHLVGACARRPPKYPPTPPAPITATLMVRDHMMDQSAAASAGHVSMDPLGFSGRADRPMVGPMPTCTIHLLGGFRVELDGRPVGSMRGGTAAVPSW